jgi:hydrogenase nickel incorporation protein HypB
MYAEQDIVFVNVVSSPGCGKTALLVRRIERLRDRLSVAIIETDCRTSVDAARIRATGTPVFEWSDRGSTGVAAAAAQAARTAAAGRRALVIVENRGNVDWPSQWRRGEAHNALLWSITEGDDKPLKYPEVFDGIDVLLMTKVDLLPHVAFDLNAATERARTVRPGLPVLRLSALTGKGFSSWIAWLLDATRNAGAANNRSAAWARAATRRSRHVDLRAPLETVGAQRGSA